MNTEGYEIQGNWPDGEIRVPNTNLWLNMWDVEHGYGMCKTLTSVVKYTMERFYCSDKNALIDFFSAQGYKD